MSARLDFKGKNLLSSTAETISITKRKLRYTQQVSVIKHEYDDSSPVLVPHVAAGEKGEVAHCERPDFVYIPIYRPSTEPSHQSVATSVMIAVTDENELIAVKCEYPDSKYSETFPFVTPEETFRNSSFAEVTVKTPSDCLLPEPNATHCENTSTGINNKEIDFKLVDNSAYDYVNSTSLMLSAPKVLLTSPSRTHIHNGLPKTATDVSKPDEAIDFHNTSSMEVTENPQQFKSSQEAVENFAQKANEPVESMHTMPDKNLNADLTLSKQLQGPREIFYNSLSPIPINQETDLEIQQHRNTSSQAENNSNNAVDNFTTQLEESPAVLDNNTIMSQTVNNNCNNDGSCTELQDTDKKQPEKLPIVVNIFTCNIVGCSASFSCTSDLVAHRRTHSTSTAYPNEGLHKCSYSGCDLTFKRECSLKTHLQTHEPINDNDGSDEEVDSDSVSDNYSESDINSDLESDHVYSCKDSKVQLGHFPDNTSKRDVAGGRTLFAPNSDLETHHSSQSVANPEGGLYKCQYTGCDLKFKRKNTLNTHLSTHKAKTNIDGNPDSGTTDSDPDSSDHESDSPDLDSDSSGIDQLDKHNGCNSSKPFDPLKVYRYLCDAKKIHKCDHPGCKSAFKNQFSLRKHKGTHTGIKPYKCDYVGCNSAFLSKYYLKDHKRTHTGEKPYNCLECNKSFAHNSAFKLHQQIHKGLKRYKCYYKGCGAVFKSSSNAELKAHQKTHTGEKPFKCDFPGCHAAATEPGRLRKHKLTHNPNREKRFKCEFEGCNQSFLTSFNLKTHHLIHKGEKPFKCGHEGCEFACRTFPQLQLHIRTHTGEKPYTCKFGGCNSAFKNLAAIRRHELTHTGIKPYKCDFVGCSLTFSQSCSLSRHKRTHTGEKPYKCDYVGCNAEFVQSFPLTLHKRTHTREK